MDDDYITGTDEELAENIGGTLIQALEAKGVVDPTEADIEAHGRLIESSDGLTYMWDDDILFTTEPMVTTKGVRVVHG